MSCVRNSWNVTWIDKHLMNGLIIKTKTRKITHVNKSNNNEWIDAKETSLSGFNEFHMEGPKPQWNKPGYSSWNTALTFLSDGNCLHLINEYIFIFQKVMIILFPLKQNLKQNWNHFKAFKLPPKRFWVYTSFFPSDNSIYNNFGYWISIDYNMLEYLILKIRTWVYFIIFSRLVAEKNRCI